MPYLCKSEVLLLNLFDIEHNFVHSTRACDLNHLVLEFYCLLQAWQGIYLAFHLLFLLLHSMPPIRYQVIFLTNVLYKQTQLPYIKDPLLCQDSFSFLLQPIFLMYLLLSFLDINVPNLYNILIFYSQCAKSQSLLEESNDKIFVTQKF